MTAPFTPIVQVFVQAQFMGNLFYFELPLLFTYAALDNFLPFLINSSLFKHFFMKVVPSCKFKFFIDIAPIIVFFCMNHVSHVRAPIHAVIIVTLFVHVDFRFDLWLFEAKFVLHGDHGKSQENLTDAIAMSRFDL
jgi:hypothetical protein